MIPLVAASEEGRAQARICGASSSPNCRLRGTRLGVTYTTLSWLESHAVEGDSPVRVRSITHAWVET